MNITGWIIVFMTSTLWQQTQVDSNHDVPKTLAGTNWISHFYHYHNNYHFDSDSTGFSEDGQIAWSCPIDTLALGIAGDVILYAQQEKFRYQIIDTVLTIEYLARKPHDTIQRRVFHYRSEYDGWISDDEHTYGRECLRQGERIEKVSLDTKR